MRAWPLLLLTLVVACGDDADATFVLDADRELQLQGGALTLVVGERSTFTLSPDAGPKARTYDLMRQGAAGIWTYRERNVVETPMTRRSASLEGDTLQVEYAGGDYEGVLTVRPDGAERTRYRFELTAGGADSVAIPVRCDDEGSFHGFGEQYNATDQRGEAFDLETTEQGLGREGGIRALQGDEHTTYFPMPYYLDGRGFGVLFLTDHRTRVDVCATDEAVAWIEVTDDSPLEWLVFHGPTPLDVVRQLGDEVGRPGPLPDWAFGTWIGAQGGQEDVLDEVAALEAAEIPVAAFWVQDWTGIRMNFDGGFGVEYRWEADDTLYPDLAGMIDDLHGRGYRFLGYANPFVDPDLPNHWAEMDAAGLLVDSPEGGSYVFGAPNGQSSHPDLTEPEARAYVVAALESMVSSYGMDGWMQDFGEWTPHDGVLDDGSDPAAYHNRFVVDWQAMAREALDNQRPDGDYCFFGRSGWTGVQSVAQIHWVGDQEADFLPGDGLPTVVPAMLNLGLAGQYNVTHDIAGFSGGPSTKELWMRWTELGAFTPIMRTHEGNNKLENWSWEKDEETTAHFRRFARIHDALFDTFRRLADEAQEDSAPIVRHLMLAFPEDRATWSISDQYLLGDEILVAPVLEEGATSRSVYLPAGEWFHLFTGERFDGGTTVEVDAPIGTPAVFGRTDREDLRAIE